MDVEILKGLLLELQDGEGQENDGEDNFFLRGEDLPINPFGCHEIEETHVKKVDK